MVEFAMKALIVDDSTEITDMMAQYLQLKGYDCTVLNHGKNAIEQILTKKYDFVLLDIAMPEISGLDIIDGLNKMNKIKEHKIIVLTASSVSDDELQSILKKGAAAYLRKPIELTQFLKVIKQITEFPNLNV
jgi:two-component system, OmpR family, response regulator